MAQRLAALTPGFSGADVANLVNEAALIAVRRDHSKIQMKDFEQVRTCTGRSLRGASHTLCTQASDRVIGGLEKRSKVMSPMEKRLVAFHEVCWALVHARALVRLDAVA